MTVPISLDSTIAEPQSSNEGLPSSHSRSAVIHQRFLNHAFASPEQPCLEFEGNVTTYAQVEQRSAAVARGLMSLGVQAGQVVAIVAERCDALIWVILGVLRSGAAFSVIDKAYPPKRIESLLKIAAPRIVVTCSPSTEPVQSLSTWASVLDCRQLAEIGSSRESRPNRRVSSDSLAYCLFTSGSTGRPKCVACHHAPLVNFIAWHAETFDLTGTDRFSMLSGLSHDPVLRDIFTPLSLGATLVIPRQSTITEIGGLQQFLSSKRITVAHLTPPLGQLLTSGRGRMPQFNDLRHLFWGGDKLPLTTVSALRKIAPRAEHTNFYGSTETPQAAAFYRCPEALPSDIPIGQGTRGFEVRVVDERNRVVPKGAIGEIAIVSQFLSLGYMESGHIVDPCDRHSTNPEERTYRTGDLGRVMPDGNVLVIGRSDDQVKIRGYRVDLSEVTALLRQHPKVQSAIALTVGPEDARRIAAFVSLQPGAELSDLALSEFAATSLPHYMVPSEYFFFPDGLPLLPNGKIDRQALLEEANSRLSAEKKLSESDADDPILSGFINEWADLFQRRDVGPDSTFNSLGGDSLTYVGAYLIAEERLGIVPDNWQSLSLAELAHSGQKKQRHFAMLDSIIVMRALSMTMVVAFHSSLTRLGDGATAALFIISGYLFGKSTFDDLFVSGRTKTLLRPVRNLFIPTMVFAAMGLIYNYVRFDTVQPNAALMMIDLVPVEHRFFEVNYIWYLEALIKIILCCAGLQWIAARFRPDRSQQLKFIATVASILCLFRVALPYLLPIINPGVRANNNLELIYNFNFVSNMGLFYVGILLTWIHGNREKLALIIPLTAYGILTVPTFKVMPSVYMLASVLSILYLPRIPVPRILSKVTYEIASGSLYIYLVHAWMQKPFHLLQMLFAIPPDSVYLLGVLETVFGILVGIAVAHGVRGCVAFTHSRSAQMDALAAEVEGR